MLCVATTRRASITASGRVKVRNVDLVILSVRLSVGQSACLSDTDFVCMGSNLFSGLLFRRKCRRVGSGTLSIQTSSFVIVLVF